MAKRRGNNEGSIYQRSYGSWRAQITINGKRLTFTAKTRKECQDWIRKTQNQIDAGMQYENTKITMEEFLSSWIISIRGSVRPDTVTQYNQICRDYLIPDLGNIKLMSLRPHHIQAVYDKQVSLGKGLRTVQLIHAVLHRALEHALKLGLITRNPDDATTRPRPQRYEMKVFDETQVQKLIVTAIQKEDRLLAFYHLAVTTGMRQGELLGLQWKDLDWEKGEIQVSRQLRKVPGEGYEFTTPKTKAGVRKIKIGRGTVNILKEHREKQSLEMLEAGPDWEENELIFCRVNGKPLHNRVVYGGFKKLLKDAGLPNIRFHDLRHTAASFMLNQGVPVIIASRRLGHSKPSITLDIYGHFIPSMQKEAAELMDNLVMPIEWKTAPNCTETAPDDFHK